MHSQRDSPREARDAASIHFRLSITRTDVLVSYRIVSYRCSHVHSHWCNWYKQAQVTDTSTRRDLLVFCSQLLLWYWQRGVGRCKLTDEFRRLSNLSFRSSSRLLADLSLFTHVMQLCRQRRRLSLQRRQLLTTTVSAAHDVHSNWHSAASYRLLFKILRLFHSMLSFVVSQSILCSVQ